MIGGRRFLVTALSFAVASHAAAQQRPLKVLLLYDMEGISEATDHKHTSFAYPAEYAFGRKSLTADVNAAIAGLKAGGATEIVVVDGHGSGNGTQPDVLEAELTAPARIGYRDTPFDHYMDSYDHSFDAIVAVAMHAGAGNPTGFLSHTYTFEDVEYKVNGVPFNESMILAAGAARLKIPLIMVSGDDQLEKEVRRMIPWVRYATVKQAVDRGKAVSAGRAEASRRIETAALLPGAEVLANASAVQIRAGDFEEGYRLSVRLIGLAGIVARGDARAAVINAQPNAPQLRVNVTDWLYDRFLDRLPLPVATTAASGARPRFWGAR